MASKFTVVIIGNGTMAAQGLAAVLTHFGTEINVPLVVCDNSDNGVDSDYVMGDGTAFRKSLKKTAMEHGFKEGETVICGRANSRRVRECISNARPHVILSLQCRDILKGKILSIPKLGTLNVHNAPLPLLRGCDPFAWAIHDGLKTFGVTLHCVDLGCDSGDIVAQELFPISSSDTAWSLFQKSLPCSITLLKENLLSYLRKEVQHIPQGNRFVTYHPAHQFSYQPILIEWNTVAVTLSAWIRARIFPPFQLPFFTMLDKRRSTEIVVMVLECSSIKHTGKSSPGIVRCTKESLQIDAKWGTIIISKVKVQECILCGTELAKKYGLVANDDISSTCSKSQEKI